MKGTHNHSVIQEFFQLGGYKAMRDAVLVDIKVHSRTYEKA